MTAIKNGIKCMARTPGKTLLFLLILTVTAAPLTELGEQRTRPLPKGLSHLRIFIDRSSVEIFVNDGDAVFSSRIFPAQGEDRLRLEGDASLHLWELKPAVTDDF